MRKRNLAMAKKKPIKSDMVTGVFPNDCKWFVGIDPGVSNGCMARLCIEGGDILDLKIIPLKNMSYGDVYDKVFMASDISYNAITTIEEVNLQGKASHSMDKLMKHAGACLAALDNTRATYLTAAPSHWRSVIYLTVKGLTPAEKAVYLYERAKLLTQNKWEFPKYASDAVLLALYSNSIWWKLRTVEE